MAAQPGVSYANSQVIGYDLAAVLRNGVFRVVSPTFQLPWVVGQAFTILALSNVIFGICVGLHKGGVFMADKREITILDSVFTYFTGMTVLLFSFFVFKSLGGVSGRR